MMPLTKVVRHSPIRPFCSPRAAGFRIEGAEMLLFQAFSHTLGKKCAGGHCIKDGMIRG
jgi:hypothetical protein